MTLVRAAFEEGRMAEEAMWQAGVLTPKGIMEYCGIGLSRLVWKVVVVILNLRLTSSITYHDLLYILWEGWIRQCHPQGQTDTAVSFHEGGGLVHDIYGPAQGVWHLG